MKLTTITPDQAARFAEWSKKWIDIGLSTEPADFDTATEAALKAYKLCNLNKPMVVLRMSSPYGATLGGVLAWALLREAGKASEQVGSQVWSQVGSQVESQVWSQVESQVRSQVGSQVWSQVESQVRSQVGSQVWSQVGSQVWSQVESQVGSQVWSQVGSQVESQVWSAVYNDRSGQLWASWAAYVSFFRDVMGWKDPVLERFEIDEALIKSCGWVWWHENVLAISDRPTVVNCDETGRLHCETGPSIAYRDGWALYHWHGVTVPQDVIESPQGITVQRIEEETNAEVRRVMIDRYGPARYTLDSGAIVVDEAPADHPLKGLRTARLLVKNVPDDEPIVYADLLNSTPEPDGTVKRYQLRVDPNAYGGEAMRNVQAAAASTWRNADGSLTYRDWRDYAPLAES